MLPSVENNSVKYHSVEKLPAWTSRDPYAAVPQGSSRQKPNYQIDKKQYNNLTPMQERYKEDLLRAQVNKNKAFSAQ